MNGSGAARRLAREVSRARAQAEALELAPVVLVVPSPAPPVPPPRARARASAAPVRALVSRLPSLPRPTAKASGAVLALAALAGVLVLATRRRASAAPAATLPPSNPPPPPSSQPSSPPPVVSPPATSPPAPSSPPVVPPAPGELAPDWQTSTGGLLVLNSLPGFHRSTAAERRRDPDVVSQAASFLKFPVKTVHLVTAKSGRRWVMAIEEHNNHPNTIGPKNKGVSMFVQNE